MKISADEHYIESLVDQKIEKIAKALCVVFPEEKYTIAKIFADVCSSSFDGIINLDDTDDKEYQSPFADEVNISHDSAFIGDLGELSITRAHYNYLKHEKHVEQSSFDAVSEPEWTRYHGFKFNNDHYVPEQEELNAVPDFIRGSDTKDKELDDRLAESMKFCDVIDRMLKDQDVSLDRAKEELGTELYNKLFNPPPSPKNVVAEVKPAKDPERLHLQYLAGVIDSDTYQKLSGKKTDETVGENSAQLTEKNHSKDAVKECILSTKGLMTMDEFEKHLQTCKKDHTLADPYLENKDCF